jgi:poly-beta-1,6-N-acetyl-D-glucosamine synthase
MESDYPVYLFLEEAVFLYPFIMSWVWMVGGIIYYFVRERKDPGPDAFPPFEDIPPVSVIIPCHNEQDQIDETVAALAETNYPEELFEVIAVNDGSTDQTAEKLDALARRHPFLKVVHLAQNKGKALAMKTGALMARSEFLVCIDGDALLEPNAVAWLVFRLSRRPNFGAVTGNPRIRNRSTLLGKLQVGEFSSIVGLIKRTQMVYGKIFTISGVVAAFRKTALSQVGYWGPDMLTDDIDVTWRLQKAGWRVPYVPNAMCWILMPETLRGLWSQRLRWARGGAETVFKHGSSLLNPKNWHMLPILFDYLLSLLWANAVLVVTVGFLVDIFSGFTLDLGLRGFLPSLLGALLGTTFLLQSVVSMTIESRFEKGLFRYYVWLIWYPLVYWMIMALTTIVGFYKTLFSGRKKLATWVSPDRGLRQ